MCVKSCSEYFTVAVTNSDELCPRHDRDVQTHLNEDHDHRCHGDAPVVTTTPCYVLEYFEQYLTNSDAQRSRRMWTDGNLLKVQDCV